MRRLLLVAASIAAAAALTSGASAAERKPTVYGSPLLWATVNVCDTVDKPNTLGVRASMPGSGLLRERMYVRFQVQYRSSRDGLWHNIGPSGDSGWIRLGSARYKARQAGRDFTLRPPAEGQTSLVRGAVTFEWRRGTEVIRRARKRTEAGHPGTAGADPEGYSAATCEIR